jgi:diguanylate cyclase (GGDEF)-like protein
MEKLKLLRPEILAPLRARDDLIGFLAFSRKFSGQDFTESDLQQIAFIAEVAGILIENARLYEMATHDRMSGLFVNHYFKNALFTEFNRARRYRKPLALVMADIDHFKQVNDTWGHQKGDTVIQEIAAILKSGIREIDILARYGGEEFALILPETAIESACTVAERLREMVQEHRFVDAANPVPVTASFGVAVLQRRFGSSEELIKAADDALYKAKNGGRNQVAR